MDTVCCKIVSNIVQCCKILHTIACTHAYISCIYIYILYNIFIYIPFKVQDDHPQGSLKDVCLELPLCLCVFFTKASRCRCSQLLYLSTQWVEWTSLRLSMFFRNTPFVWLSFSFVGWLRVMATNWFLNSLGWLSSCISFPMWQKTWLPHEENAYGQGITLYQLIATIPEYGLEERDQESRRKLVVRKRVLSFSDVLAKDPSWVRKNWTHLDSGNMSALANDHCLTSNEPWNIS